MPTGGLVLTVGGLWAPCQINHRQQAGEAPRPRCSIGRGTRLTPHQSFRSEVNRDGLLKGTLYCPLIRVEKYSLQPVLSESGVGQADTGCLSGNRGPLTTQGSLVRKV